MKELDFLNIIDKTLDNTSYLGDDCAFLDDLNIFVTQDTLVEDVHFSMSTTTPYFLGRKSVNVNLSDLAAALSTPKYITISLSMPKNITNKFVEELYRGINDVCKEFNVKVIGGDITGSEKITISITAIGKKKSKYLCSRSFAKKDDLIIVTGNFGSSATGLYALSEFLYIDDEIVKEHINPKARVKEAKLLAKTIDCNTTTMDCSDGLIDALYKISKASKHTVKIDMNLVPINEKVKEFCKQNKLDYKHFAKWGGEDYELLFCLPKETYNKLDKNIFKCIGKVMNKNNLPCVIVEDENQTEKITKEIFENKSYNHF